MGISFVLGIPAYFLDVRSKRPFAAGLFLLFVLRWLIMCFFGSRHVLSNPVAWPAGTLLFLTLLFVQLAKLLNARDSH